MIEREPKPGTVCRDRLGQAWLRRWDYPPGWQRVGSGVVVSWDLIPRDLRDSFVVLVPEHAALGLAAHECREQAQAAQIEALTYQLVRTRMLNDLLQEQHLDDARRLRGEPAAAVAPFGP